MSDRPVVYVTRRIPDAGIELLEEECEVHVREKKLPPSRGELRERLEELQPDGLLCLLSEEIDGELLDAVPGLRVVSTFSVGYDHVDVEAAADRNVAVGHTPGVLSDTTADFAWTMLMTCARRTVEGHEYVRDGEWETWGPTLLTGPDVHGATLGIVGLGDIGATVAKRTAGFDMEVLYSDVVAHEETVRELRKLGVDIRRVEQDELLRESDFVTLHVPLMEATRGLIGEEQLRAMKPGAVLVNTSRGPVVDTDALDTALENDWIARAGLDVTDPEPLPPDHPIARHVPEKLVVTPHIASASIGTRDRMAEMAAQNLLAGLRGEALPNSAIEDAGV